MHRSRLAGPNTDRQTGDHDAAAQSGSEAWCYFVQAEQIQIAGRGLDSDGDNRNIEADDIEAEVARLDRLGAGRITLFMRWWAMEAPTGQRLCVVRPQHPRFEALSSEWRT